jgi:multiple sugar transport system permease protein
MLLKIKKHIQKYIFLFFIMPAIIWIVTFSIYPFLYSVYISFTNMNMLRPGNFKFVGLQNYLTLFDDIDFWVSFRNTFLFTIPVVVFQFLFGFLLALLLKTKKFGTPVVRTAVMLPWVLAPVALGLVWGWLLRGGKLGLINAILVLSGIHPINWLSHDMAMFSVIVIAIWIGTPFSFMLELAGLQKIPVSLYEASLVDGASKLQKLLYITIPLMRGTFLINWIMITISTIGYFDIIYALTDGGPGNATEILPLLMYHRAFEYFNLGQGAAIAMIMSFISLLFTLIYFTIFYRRKA